MSQWARYTQKAPKTNKIIYFKGSRAVLRGDIYFRGDIPPEGLRGWFGPSNLTKNWIRLPSHFTAVTHSVARCLARAPADKRGAAEVLYLQAPSSLLVYPRRHSLTRLRPTWSVGNCRALGGASLRCAERVPLSSMPARGEHLGEVGLSWFELVWAGVGMV